jgi:molybdopterin-guanine dinucleotide biosynthesis protein A
VQFIADIPPSCGPLSGTAASLVKIHTAHLLALAIDMPFMTENYLRSICDAIEPVVVLSRRSTIVPSRWRPYIRAKQRLSFALRLQALIFHCKTSFVHLVTSGKLLEISVTKKERRFFRNVNNVSDVDATMAGG